MSKFERSLADKDFVVTVEIDPPKGIGLDGVKDLASKLEGKADALVISDNPGAQARMSPLTVAQALLAGGSEVIVTLTCRDRNRLALTSDLLAAAGSGLDNVLIVTGDFVNLGDHPDAKPVYDLDSVQAMGLALSLAEGRDLSGSEVEGRPGFFIGGSAAPGSTPLAPQVMKIRKKVAAGARFIITQPVDSIDQLQAFMDQAGDLGVKVLAGIEAGDGLDASAAGALFGRIKASGLVAGVHLSAPVGEGDVMELVEACGL